MSVLALSLAAASAAVAAPFAYVSNFGSGTVSVIDVDSGAVCLGPGQSPPPCVVATIHVGSLPSGTMPGGVAVNPAGTLAYVANKGDGTVSVIGVGTNNVVTTVQVGTEPWGVAVSGDGAKVYVGLGNGMVAVIDAGSNNVLAPINLGGVPGVLNGLVVSGSRVYVSDAKAGQVVVIDVSNPLAPSVAARIGVGSSFNAMPMGLVANASGTRVYVVDLFQDAMTLITSLEVSAIDTASSTRAASETVTLDPDPALPPTGNSTMATPGGIALSPDGSRLYVTNDSLDEVTVVRLSDKSLTHVSVGKFGDTPVGVATDPAGRVYVGNAGSGTVTILDAANAIVKRVTVGSTPFVFGAFVTAGPPPPVQFALNLAPVGNGTITADPPSATGNYNAGASVNLRAVPGTGFQFAGWSGDCSGTSSPCTVTMNAPKNVTATFTVVQYPLSVSTVGTGTVTLAPQPAAAGNKYDAGTMVTLTAKPDAGFQFSAWSIDCSGTSNPCTLTMDAPKNVMATFAASAPPPPSPTACEAKINDLEKKVAAHKHPRWHDYQLRDALRMYWASMHELGRARGKVGDRDKRYVHAQNEFKEGRDALCNGRYWRAEAELWEAYLIAKQILKHHWR